MMNMFTRFSRKYARTCTIGLLFILTVVISVIHAGKDQQRVVAIADVHGDFDAFVAILQQAEIIDANHDWIAGNTILVQTGDFLDRGPDDRKVMDFLMELEKQAPKQEGRLEVLLGNHEVMNMMGDLRYVTTEAYASFAGKKPEKLRKDAYKKYKKLLKQRAKALNQQAPEFTIEMEGKWIQTHPPGFFEHREAFSSKGKYGQWLRKHSAVAQIGNTIFLHGGISPELSAWTVENINERVKSEIEAFDTFREYMVKQKMILPFFTTGEMLKAAQSELAALIGDTTSVDEGNSNVVIQLTELENMHVKFLGDFLDFPTWLSANKKGPLWFRGFANWSDELGLSHMDSLSMTYGVEHFVVGHTPQLEEGRIKVRFDGKVFLIDTGLSNYYGGHPSALEIQNGKFTAIYLDKREVLLDPEAVPLPADTEEQSPR